MRPRLIWMLHGASAVVLLLVSLGAGGFVSTAALESTVATIQANLAALDASHSALVTSVGTKYDANTAQFAPPVAASAAAGQYCAAGDLTTCFYITSSGMGLSSGGASVLSTTLATGKTRFRYGSSTNTGSLARLGATVTISGANNNSTTETDLSPWTVAANALDASGSSVILEQSGTFASSASSVKRLRAYFNGTQIFDSNSGSTASTAADAYFLRAEVVRTNTTTARANVTFLVSKPGASPGSTYTAAQSTNLTSQDFTTTNIFKITGQAGASNEILSNYTRGMVNN